MAGKKNKPIRLDELTQEEKLKYEIAEELGLLDKVREDRRADDKEEERTESMSGCTLKVTKLLRILISMNI